MISENLIITIALILIIIGLVLWDIKSGGK
jgi:nitrogen fixation-related uncharacterized protein